MAGRGRQSTLPAWMTSGDGAAGVDLASMPQQGNINPIEHGQFDDNTKTDSNARSNGHSGNDSRATSSRDERPRKSRSRDRGHRSSRSTRSRYVFIFIIIIKINKANSNFDHYLSNL